MKKKLMAEIELLPIMVPNFILTVDKQPIPVTDFSIKELKELGAQFTEDLIAKRAKGISGPV
jgi:hypothetical protein